VIRELKDLSSLRLIRLEIVIAIRGEGLTHAQETWYVDMALSYFIFGEGREQLEQMRKEEPVREDAALQNRGATNSSDRNFSAPGSSAIAVEAAEQKLGDQAFKTSLATEISSGVETPAREDSEYLTVYYTPAQLKQTAKTRKREPREQDAILRIKGAIDCVASSRTPKWYTRKRRKELRSNVDHAISADIYLYQKTLGAAKGYFQIPALLESRDKMRKEESAKLDSTSLRPDTLTLTIFSTAFRDKIEPTIFLPLYRPYRRAIFTCRQCFQVICCRHRPGVIVRVLIHHGCRPPPAPNLESILRHIRGGSNLYAGG